MEAENKKISPYAIIILILVLVTVGFAYDKWGKGFLPASVENLEEETSDTTIPTDVDTKVAQGDLIIGNENAPVTIVEYYSYFCGYCKVFKDETEPQLIQNYVSTGKARIVLRPFPPFELGMAVACANDQSKFLEYHSALFEKASEIQAIEDLSTIAGSIGMDTTIFDECFTSQKYAAKAQEWYAQGQVDFEGSGVPEDQRGTPAFFIDGELLIGAQPYDAFVTLIEQKLAE